jgi:hypothetical protein
MRVAWFWKNRSGSNGYANGAAAPGGVENTDYSDELPFVSSEVETRSAQPTSLDFARDERISTLYRAAFAASFTSVRAAVSSSWSAMISQASAARSCIARRFWRLHAAAAARSLAARARRAVAWSKLLSHNLVSDRAELSGAAGED